MITKKQSKMLQGIAILLMIYHHFYVVPDFTRFSFINAELTQKAVWFAKICVGLFSFVSGYGMSVVLSKIRARGGRRIWCRQYANVGKRLLRLFFKYWFVVLLDVLLCFCVFRRTTTGKEILENAFLIRLSLNGSWWFMREYLLFMLLAPVLDLLLTGIQNPRRSKRLLWGSLSLLLLAGVMGIKLFVPALEDFFACMPLSFVLVFLVGYLSGKYGVYAFLEKKLPSSKGLQIGIGLLLVVTMIILRMSLATDASYAKLDFFIVPVFSLGAILLLRQTRVPASLLETMGEHSTYMWLTHLLVYELTAELVLRLTSQSLLFYGIEVMLTFVFAWLLQNIQKILMKCRLYFS